MHALASVRRSKTSSIWGPRAIERTWGRCVVSQIALDSPSRIRRAATGGSEIWSGQSPHVGGQFGHGSNLRSTYFFEWCVWGGYAVAGFAYAPGGLIALAPQAIILASIFGVTGIPPTENQALRSKGEAYRDYQKRVSKFVPWPPKRT